MQHRVRRQVHQVVAIDVRNNLHALGQHAGVQKLDLVVDVAKDGFGFRALAHLHDAFDHVVVVGDASIVVANGLA